MEDRKNAKARTENGEAERIVDLTPDMEVPEQSAVKIIDLTDAIDGPVESDATDSPPFAAETPAAEPVEETPEPEPATTTGEQVSDGVEQEVEVAFDAMQAPVDAEPVQTESADALLDKFSDIPRRVDESGETGAESIEPESDESRNEPGAEEDSLSADAAELEAAIEGDAPDEEEEVIELTDRVEDTGVPTTGFETDDGQEEIIELTEIVDPAELQAGAEPEDEEIIELTEIVDPAELDAAGAPWDDTEVLELTDVVDPLELEAAPADEGPSGNALADELGSQDAPRKEAEPMERKADESVIRLSDVLEHQAGRDELPPIEQVEVGADEALATHNVSLEAEDTAQSLGLDLEQENREEDVPLTQREIEMAVERIIQEKYAATIEKLIARAVEQAVSREMENIRRAMLDGDEPQA